MSSRRPRRQRRRRERASTLPRPGQTAAPPRPAGETAARIPDQTRPEHHVATDYGYVRRDLVVVGAVSAITLAFVIAAAFIA